MTKVIIEPSEKGTHINKHMFECFTSKDFLCSALIYLRLIWGLLTISTWQDKLELLRWNN